MTAGVGLYCNLDKGGSCLASLCIFWTASMQMRAPGAHRSGCVRREAKARAKMVEREDRETDEEYYRKKRKFIIQQHTGRMY